MAATRTFSRLTNHGRRILQEDVSGVKPVKKNVAIVEERFKPFRCDVAGYTKKFLGFTPWLGMNDSPGQAELFQDISESVQKQLAKDESAIRIFRVESGHGLGKTRGVGAISNWFFDCFAPAVIITTAPSSDQVKYLLWRDIKELRAKAKEPLPGRVLPDSPMMRKSPTHFAIGRTTSDSGGKGTTRMQGVHAPYLLFILDEAEGVPKFFFDAVNAMMTGGTVVICILIGNPQTRSSEFYRWGKKRGVKNYRWSAHNFPNVALGKEIIPGGTTRTWVCNMVAEHCEVVGTHDEDEMTFTLPYMVVSEEGEEMPPGTIFKPDTEYMFRVMGVAPINSAMRSLISVGAYEAAKKRKVEPTAGDIRNCRIGIDAARFGDDRGTVYVNHKLCIRRAGSIFRQETSEYIEIARVAALRAIAEGAQSVHIRVDGTGGFGAGIVDGLRNDYELNSIEDFRVFEVHFASAGTDPDGFSNIITQCYSEAGKTIKGIHIINPPEELEADLTDRLVTFVNRHGRTVKQLEPKEAFRKRNMERSPDDGDGFVLAAAPDLCFFATPESASPTIMSIPQQTETVRTHPSYDSEGRFIPPIRVPTRPIRWMY